MKLKSTLNILTLLLFSSLSTYAANYFWVGGSGSWSDYSAHWATTSGGAVFHTQVPQSTDNVFFDANSFATSGQTVIVDQPIVQCANMNWTGVTNLPTFAGDYANTLKIYGSLTLASNMGFTFEGPISFEATTAGKTISTYNKFINSSLSFNGIGGAWTLVDDLKTTWIYLNNGTFNTNSKSINAYSFRSTTSSTRALHLGSSVISLSFYGSIWNINPTGMTLNAGTSTIKGVGQSGGAQDFYGGGFNYNNIFFTGTQAGKINGNSVIKNVSFAGDGYIQCACNFNDVSFNGDAYFMEGSNFNNVVISQNGNFSSSNTFQNLKLSPNQTYLLAPNETQTINQTLTATGACGTLINIRSSTQGAQSTIKKASGTVQIDYVSLQDINATGGATFIANNTSNLGNNSGWTINSMTPNNLYWIGNGGNWNDGNHWSLTSGGASIGCAPRPIDNVIFDANSFSQANATVVVNVPTAAVNDMTWINVANTPEFYGDYSNALKIYGSLTLCSGINFNYSGLLSFDAASGNKTITTAGNAINTSMWFNGIGAEWTLQDNLTCNYWIYLNGGTLSTNNKTVNAYAFNSITSSSRALNLGSSIINLSFNGLIWKINPLGMVLNSGASKIYGVGFTGGEQYFIGGGFVYNDLSFIGAALGKVIDSNTMHNVFFGADGFIQGGSFNNVDFTADATLYYTNICNEVKIAKNATIFGSNTFNSLQLTPGYTYTFAGGETQTINNALVATGSCGGLIEIRSGTPGVQTTISKTAGLVELSYLSIKDVAVTGGATFIANSTNDLGNNNGWSTANTSPLVAKNLYWIGNSGDWNDGNHWSLTSGGSPSGCSPTPIDNAYFDSNSFSSANQTVNVNVPNAFANNMIWTGVSNNPTFYGDYNNTLKIYGSLTLAQGVNFDFTGALLFEATTTGQTITTAGAPINTSIVFNGIGGSWTLQDNLTTNYWIYLNNGTLNTNNKTVNAYAFNSITSSVRGLNLGSSVINLSFNGLIWKINPTGMALNAGTSVIKGIGASGGQQDFLGGGFTYNNIFFVGSALGKIVDNNTINDLSFSSDGFIQGGQFHDVTFSGNATMYYTNTCNTVKIAKDATIYGSNNFFFLKLSPGYTYTFNAGETQTILSGGNICAEGTGSLPIRIQSSLPGVPTTISKPDGGVCWDYVRISDVKAIGGAVFNAGLAPDNSEDMGGNTGFIYSGGCLQLGCAPCVPPSITTQPLTAQICASSNANATFAVVATGTGINYQWQVLQGTSYVNVSNNTIYSGATSNTLVVTNTSGLNGNKYRCNIQGVCGNALVSDVATLTINQQPVVTATTNGSSVSVTATGGTAPYTGTGTFTVATSGTYTYTVTDAKGCSASATVNVVICITPSITTQPLSTQICTGSNATFLVTAIGTGLSYQWQVLQGTSYVNVLNNTIYGGAMSNTLTIANTAGLNGSKYRCNVQTACGSSLASNIVTLTINSQPVVTASANGSSVSVTATGGTAPYTGIGTFTVAASGTYTYNVTDAKGCSASATVNVVICITPSITTQPLNTQICAGSNATFVVAATGAGLSYQWQVLQGTSYVNVLNSTIYGGATSNTLTIANTTGLNGSKYRCNVQAACGNSVSSSIVTLTINPQPVVTAIANGSSVSVTATGGTAPYSGTGTFTVATSGTYTYTVTDAKGCVGSKTVSVTVNPTADVIPPVAKCKNATLTLSNGTATLNASQVNNGSTDNVGIASITVSPNTFNCASIGVKTVTLTVKDNAGNTSTCQAQVTILGSIPTVTITQSGLPNFGQGVGSILTANTNQGVTYLWNSGETTNTKNVTSSGTSSVTVRNTFGCSSTASLSVNYNASDLASSYTLIGTEEITLEENSYVQSGAAGVTKNNGDIDVKSGSKITGASTFARAKYIYVSSSSTVTQKIYTQANIILPVYKSNPYCGGSGDDDDDDDDCHNNNNGNNNWNNNSWNNNNNCNNNGNNNWNNNGWNNNNNCNNNNNGNNNWNNNNNCNNNGNNNWNNNNNCNNNGNNSNNNGQDKSVSNNATVVLTDSIYGDVTIGTNATVTFNSPVVYVKSLTTGSNTKINFNGCTEIRICGKVVIGQYNTFNLAAKGVVIYSDEEVEIKKGTNFTAAVYTKKDLQTEGDCNARITMKGMFIAKKVKSEYTSWNWNNSNAGCNFTRSLFVENTEEEISEGSVLEDMNINVFPNPSTDNFSVVLNSENTAPYAVKVYDMGGRLMFSNANVEAIEVLSFGKDLQKGTYLMTVSQGYNSKTLRIVKTE